MQKPVKIRVEIDKARKAAKEAKEGVKKAQQESKKQDKS